MKEFLLGALFALVVPLAIFGWNFGTATWLGIVVITVIYGIPAELKNQKTRPSEIDVDKNITSVPKPNVIQSKAFVTSTSYTKQQLRQIAFDYTDSEGACSYREVAVNSVDDYYIKAFCLSRQATRTFRIDRIDGFITMRETGELLSVSDWLHLFR